MTEARTKRTPPGMTPQDVRRIAVKAACDPYCVAKYVTGLALRSTTIDRIETALRNSGMEQLIGARQAALAAAKT